MEHKGLACAGGYGGVIPRYPVPRLDRLRTVERLCYGAHFLLLELTRSFPN